MGGLGCNTSMTLTAAGVGTLILCDHDTISISNLNRQLLYRETDIGKKKVTVAIDRLQKINGDPDFIAVDGQFSERLLPSSVKPQLILDCLDNLSGRIELIAYAVKKNIPLVHAAVDGFMGQLSVFIPQESACPVCGLTGDMERDDIPIPSLGACVAIMAGVQATEAIKFITNSGELCINKFMFFDGLSSRIEIMDLERDHNCIACSR
jgi:molybdopterin/thiamine biosynthesis adenylyltransferase